MQRVSVPFDAGRGLMRHTTHTGDHVQARFSTLRCGSWIDAPDDVAILLAVIGFSTLRCGSWIDAAASQYSAELLADVSVPFDAGRGLMPTSPAQPAAVTTKFQYPSMRVVE